MNILSVTEATRAIKEVLEAEFPFLWVRGQVTNVGRPASGHVYFTLSDGDAALSVVWFKSSHWQTEQRAGSTVNPLTGEVVEEGGDGADLSKRLEDGMEVLVAGRINVYEPRGQYQLVAELVQEQGISDLALAFEAMKRKLAAKGYFDDDHKMRPPKHPERVAVVTSSTGAAIRDFLRISEQHGWGAEIRIYPTLVQGKKAPANIATQLDRANLDDWAEVIVLIRGGGSLEDLWAFNTEEVAEAIFRSHIPVVVGVGHEPDVSIADYVADVRASTPSHAAQLLWPRRDTLRQQVDDLDFSLKRAFNVWFNARAARVEELGRALAWLSPARRLERLDERRKDLSGRLDRAMASLLRDREQTARGLTERLLRAHGEEQLYRRTAELVELVRRMELAVETGLSRTETSLRVLEAGLRGLDPEGPLERGYSLVRVEKTGRFLRATTDVAPGDALDIRVREGRVAARVTDGQGGEGGG